MDGKVQSVILPTYDKKLYAGKLKRDIAKAICNIPWKKYVLKR